MTEDNKQWQIHNKGFRMSPKTTYNKIKIGKETLTDAILDLGTLTKIPNANKYLNKMEVLKSLYKKDIKELRNISNVFYSISGIYRRVCNLFACLYRYDWYITPETYSDDINEDKIIKDFQKILNFFDNSNLRKMCGDIALEVIKNGVYYGYIIPTGDRLVLQDLPVNYCRSRYSIGDVPVVEFDMKYFDTIRDDGYRLKVLKLFPKEFEKGYRAYRKKTLVDEAGKPTSWFILDSGSTVKFYFNKDEMPLFISAVPAILDLDAAQDLDRRKQMQKLLKIIVQKLPLDKNGDLIFDVDEAADIHENAVEMLKRAVGVDVLTTFTDVEAIDMSDRNTSTTTDDIAKVERTLFNNLGISQSLFNSDKNLSLEKSILNDESYVRTLLLQFNMFFNRVISAINVQKKKYNFRFQMLETTQYNYKELAKLYKEQTQLGFSKLLPQIALGHSQSFILNSIFFENNILHLSQLMVPPLSSNTMNGEDLRTMGTDVIGKKTNQQNIDSDNKGGRPEKAEGEKSDKTLANQEAAG